MYHFLSDQHRYSIRTVDYLIVDRNWLSKQENYYHALRLLTFTPNKICQKTDNGRVILQHKINCHNNGNGDTKRKTMEYNEGTFKYMLKKNHWRSRVNYWWATCFFMCPLVISSGYLDRTRDLYRRLYIFGSYSHKNTIIFQWWIDGRKKPWVPHTDSHWVSNFESLLCWYPI